MSGKTRLAAAGSGLAIALFAAAPASAGRDDDARAFAVELNRRWAGAQATLRVPIQITHKTDRDGWRKSGWMCKERQTSKDQAFCFLVKVSDFAAIRYETDGESILPGARFKVIGWAFEDPNDAKGLYLDLEFLDAPARIRWAFTAGGLSVHSRVKGEEMVHIERYMRIDAYDLRSAEEQLVTVAPARPTRIPDPPAPAPVVTNPELRLVSVAVQPARVRAGQEVRLVMTYEVAGLPPTTQLEVLEVRRLATGNREVARFDVRVSRSAGTYLSELPVWVPADATAGMYGLDVALQLAAATASGSAFFQVVGVAAY